ncbi:hypothetical protein [Nocardia sp. CC227C]|uniref:hypothetical protein n=1 Tax=Nocardia sp. CC227C TaxID=3044562 RepID=UPI00278C8505|nr:hypothetical protein [Nocardia sp. CC227C]
MTRTRTGLGATTALLALTAPFALAGSAAADIEDISITGVDERPCSVAAGCLIQVTVTQFEAVDFLVNNTAIGTATPQRTNSGLITATLQWRPEASGTYTVGARQARNTSTIVYTVTQHASGCGWLPTGSASGSAGTGSASGSVDSGSAGSGSAGSGSAGSGSASGSAC